MVLSFYGVVLVWYCVGMASVWYWNSIGMLSVYHWHGIFAGMVLAWCLRGIGIGMV